MYLLNKCAVNLLTRFTRIFILAAALLFVSDKFAFCQNNPFKIDDEVYAYYLKCLKYTHNDVVLKMTDTMFNMAKAKKDVKAQCLALHVKGEYFFNINDAANLIKSKDRLEKFAVNTPYKQYIFSMWNRVIVRYLNNKQYSNALEELKKYQKEALRLNDCYGIGNTYVELGNLYLSQGNKEQGLKEMGNAVAYYRANGKSQEAYYIYSDIGNIYLAMNKLDSAKKYYLLSLDVTGTEQSKGPQYLQLARIYQRYGDMSEAMRYMKMLNEWEKKFALSSVSRINKFRFYSDYYLNLKDYDKALTYCDSVTNFHKYLFKSSIYEKMGDYKNAFENYRHFCSEEGFDLSAAQKDELAKYTALYDKERVEKEKNALALKNTQLALEQLSIRDKLLNAEQAGNKLMLSNTRLELNNKNLALKTQQAEVAKQKAEASRQRLIGINLRQHANSQRNFAVIIVFIFMVLSGVAIVYAIQRQRTAKALRKEVDNVKKAREEADKARDAAEKSQKEAENANKMKSLFIQNMSHEIRTPLNAIIGFTDLMNDPESDLKMAEKEEFTKMVHQNGTLLATLINDILDLSKLESGTYEIRKERASALEICRQAAASVKDRTRNDVVLSFDSQVKDVMFVTDPQRLAQILINLLTNACKCTEHGSIKLTYIADNKYIHFSVTDTGCGIPIEDSERIFDRFEKLDKFKQGTGLGLNICRQIAGLLGGKIYVDTSYSHGARFVFEQPLELPLELQKMSAQK
jgi:signal transduction histidine kinase